MIKLGSGESKLETAISYLLITGIVISLVLITAGMVLFYIYYGNLNISLDNQLMYVHGRDFFSFLYELVTQQYSRNNSITLITFGVATLLATMYLRVVLSFFYFAWKKDIKYLIITAFVLTVLTLSLILH